MYSPLHLLFSSNYSNQSRYLKRQTRYVPYLMWKKMLKWEWEHHFCGYHCAHSYFHAARFSVWKEKNLAIAISKSYRMPTYFRGNFLNLILIYLLPPVCIDSWTIWKISMESDFFSLKQKFHKFHFKDFILYIKEDVKSHIR